MFTLIEREPIGVTFVVVGAKIKKKKKTMRIQGNPGLSRVPFFFFFFGEYTRNVIVVRRSPDFAAG